jgi:hypothetical protein
MLLMQVIRLPLKPEAREAIRQRMKAVHARAAAAKEPPPARKEPPEPKFTRAQEQHVEARIKARVRELETESERRAQT